MIKCKNCGNDTTVKNGRVRNKQRYKCKECGYNFVEGDMRTNEKIAAKKAMCILLYSLAKASFNMMGKLFDMYPSQVYRWIVDAGAKLPEQEVSGEIKHMEFDEMWHYIGMKKTKFGSSKPLTVACGEPWPGCSAIVILQRSNDFMTK